MSGEGGKRRLEVPGKGDRKPEGNVNGEDMV